MGAKTYGEDGSPQAGEGCRQLTQCEGVLDPTERRAWANTRLWN